MTSAVTADAAASTSASAISTTCPVEKAVRRPSASRARVAAAMRGEKRGHTMTVMRAVAIDL